MCKLDSASSILLVFRLQFNCFSVQDLFVFRLVQKSPPGFFQTGSGDKCDVKMHQEKAPRHCVQVKRSLISIFWKSRVYLDYSIAINNIGRIQLTGSACRFGLKFSSRKIHPTTGVKLVDST